MAADTQALSFPDELGYLGETHEWGRLDGDICTVGISDYAQHEIGDVVYVELPSVGDTVEANSDFGVIESVKSAFDLMCPMSGEVIEINEALEASPEHVNDDPYGEGWMIRVKVSDPAEFEQLMNAADYQSSVTKG
ncbi:MAG: glycine cleavage system protein GcvH [Candidatus Poribacteria bacterium]|nr:glycine cleavage system protein GcvH [Candidatus Poribacteria bacterium]